MTPCDGTATSTKWCCGKQNTTCCGIGQEIILPAVLGATTSTPASTPSSTLSTGSKAGIGVGCTALAVIVVGAIFYYNKRRKRSQEKLENGLASEYVTKSFQDERRVELHGMPKQQLSEVQGDGVRIELS